MHLGSRNHFRGGDKDCRREEVQGIRCRALETRVHFFKNCIRVNDIYCSVITIVESVLKKKVDEKSIFTMSFRCKDRIVNIVVVWFLVQVLEHMYYSNVEDPVLILERVEKEIDWIQRYTCKYADSFQTLKMEIRMQIMSFNYDL